MNAGSDPHDPDQLLEQAYTEFCGAWLAGEQPDPAEFCRRYPSCGSELLVSLNEFISNFECLQSYRKREKTPYPDPHSKESAFEEKTLGDFHLLREIGRGGMGVIYKARQISLDRIVAIKVLPALLTLRPETVSRFKREASTAANLKHPGIVQIFAIGEEEGNHFFAMELIRGAPLDRVIETLALEDPVLRNGQHVGGAVRDAMILDEDQLEAEEAKVVDEESSLPDFWNKSYIELVCRICCQVAEALEYAHDAGVVHRDIKPSNILVRKDGSCVLTDFGLARMEGLPSLTSTGELTGTPHYIAPEQASLKHKGTDHRVDIFALGVTLYELITLQKAFDGRTSQEVMTKIIAKEPTLPRAMIRTIPRDLETICLKAMEKDPVRRYASAKEFRDDLLCFLEYRPIMARPVGLATRSYRLVRRNPGYSAFFALLFVVLLCGPLVFGIQQKLSNIQVRKALKQSEDERIAKEDALRQKGEALRQAEEELVLSNAVSDFLVTLFQSSDPDLALGKKITAYELLQKGAATLDLDFRDHPEIRVRLSTVMASAFLGLGDFKLAERLLKDALDNRPDSIRDDHALSLLILFKLGEIYLILNRQKDAESIINRALAASDRFEDEEELTWNLRFLNLLASLMRNQGKLIKAEELFRDSWKISEEALGREHAITIQCMMYLGYVCSERNRLDEAESLLLDCLDRCLEIFGEDDSHTDFTSSALGELYIKMGKLNKAESHLLQASERSRRVFGDMAPLTQIANIKLATLYKNMNRYEEAEFLLKGAVEGLGEKLGYHHSNTLDAIMGLVKLYMVTDLPDQALLLVRDALDKITGDSGECEKARAVLNQIIREVEGKRAE